MSSLAKRKLHELLDAVIEVRENAGPSAVDSKGTQDGLRRFMEAVQQKPKREAYLRALLKAGTTGLKLTDLRVATGESRSALGGIASGLTKIWRKYVSADKDIVERTHQQHKLTSEALKVLAGVKL